LIAAAMSYFCTYPGCTPTVPLPTYVPPGFTVRDVAWMQLPAEHLPYAALTIFYDRGKGAGLSIEYARFVGQRPPCWGEADGARLCSEQVVDAPPGSATDVQIGGAPAVLVREPVAQMMPAAQGLKDELRSGQEPPPVHYRTSCWVARAGAVSTHIQTGRPALDNHGAAARRRADADRGLATRRRPW